ncbi:hypothetical protein N8613_04020 [Verrucomicrobia bacterium]|nr:hypothetical protein [Verrucomicrobiota bacterium]
MRNQKHHIHSTTQPPSGVRRLDTALDSSRKRHRNQPQTTSDKDALPARLTACDFISECSTEQPEIKSSTTALTSLSYLSQTSASSSPASAGQLVNQ